MHFSRRANALPLAFNDFKTLRAKHPCRRREMTEFSSELPRGCVFVSDFLKIKYPDNG